MLCIDQSKCIYVMSDILCMVVSTTVLSVLILMFAIHDFKMIWSALKYSCLLSAVIKCLIYQGICEIIEVFAPLKTQIY